MADYAETPGRANIQPSLLPVSPEPQWTDVASDGASWVPVVAVAVVGIVAAVVMGVVNNRPDAGGGVVGPTATQADQGVPDEQPEVTPQEIPQPEPVEVPVPPPEVDPTIEPEMPPLEEPAPEPEEVPSPTPDVRY